MLSLIFIPPDRFNAANSPFLYKIICDCIGSETFTTAILQAQSKLGITPPLQAAAPRADQHGQG